VLRAESKGDETCSCPHLRCSHYLEDSYPFGCDRFPEPWRAPVYAVAEALALGAQLPALHQLLGLEPCCLHPQLEVSPSGRYLDFDLSLLEQKDDLEGFYEEVSPTICHGLIQSALEQGQAPEHLQYVSWQRLFWQRSTGF
uniref:FHOD1 N-terminal GTPase-binding domain-containing protein n=1 Tax=Strigops habroptila TaxID=2489341 RepID=A0A672TE92_STRHB